MSIVVILFILFIFRSWFALPLSTNFSAGDWPYLFAENIREFSYIPDIRFLWLSPYYQTFTRFLFEYGHLSWPMIEKLFWFFPFIALSGLSSYYFTKSWIGVLVYTTNTYILMVVGGGQMGVALAYALAPFVFKRFIEVPESITSFNEKLKAQNLKLKTLAFNGLLFAVQVMFDPRIALLTVVAAIAYWIVVRMELKSMIHSFGIPLGITAVLHTYWWVPLLKNPDLIGTQLHEVSSDAVKYLSFASFSQTLSLLHPNWPENVFGKVFFMMPEFLLTTLLVYGIFLWGKKQDIRAALPYGLLALGGAFLAKGSQEPFGGLYVWLFEHVPGFWLFRDSTKFYVFITLAYTYLIPVSIASLASRWKTGITASSNVLGVLFLVMWAVLIRQAVTHQLGGTFQSHVIDPEYIQLKNLITSLPDGAATYWIPSRQRFGFMSQNHPALSESDEISGGNLTTTRSSLLSADAQLRLEQKDVVYVVVPYDTSGEIFLTDRLYDKTIYEQTVEAVARIPWLAPVETFTKVRVWSLKSKLQ